MDGDLVTVTEAAQRAGLHKSTVSRQVHKLGLDRDRLGRFSFGEYEARRAGDLNPYMARGGSTALVETAPAGTAGREGEPAPRVPNGRTSDNPNTRNKEIQAELGQIKLDQQRGLLIARAEVVQVVTDAGRELRDGLLSLPGRVAGELASMTDPVEITRFLDRHMREALDAVSGKFAALEHQGVTQ